MKPRVSDARQRIEKRRRLSPEQLERFIPTAEQKNALPTGIRNFVHELETVCDHAGDLREKFIWRENALGLQALLVQSRQREKKMLRLLDSFVRASQRKSASRSVARELQRLSRRAQVLMNDVNDESKRGLPSFV